MRARCNFCVCTLDRSISVFQCDLKYIEVDRKKRPERWEFIKESFKEYRKKKKERKHAVDQEKGKIQEKRKKR